MAFVAELARVWKSCRSPKVVRLRLRLAVWRWQLLAEPVILTVILFLLFFLTSSRRLWHGPGKPFAGSRLRAPRLHPCRAPGGDRHHRHSRFPALARGAI